MEVNKELIENIAKVARLNLTEEEKMSLEQDMKEVLDAFDKIQEVDTEGVEMSVQPIKIKNSLRNDKEKECLTQEEALSQTNHKQDGYFKGPRSV
ncbi:Asp-tRNA(Asn)/Glu-tRNA(Gln) amidotransferase subunit GatC [Candidatus Woesearchaeota archaeon]|nr:Asp-tRNA(Asn)/Glu-tRNA(Gln) amidotransferase subunit GatC [Candidatus Woesearchaeota archaeon]